MPIGSTKGELTELEKKQQRGMMLVSLTGKVKAWLTRKKPLPVPLWSFVTNNMAGRYDPDAKTADLARKRMIEDWTSRHEELRKLVDTRRPK